jgi:hypothetical protein
MSIRGRNVDKGYIDGEFSAAEEIRHVGEKDRDLACSAALDGLAGVGAHKEGAVMEGLLVPGVQVGRAPIGMEVDDLHVLEWPAPGIRLAAQGERIDKGLRKGAGALHVDSVS